MATSEFSQICWHIECSTLTAPSFRILNNSTGISSPPLGFPHSSVGKESACNAGDPCLIPGLEILWRRKWQPPPVFLLGACHGQRSLTGYSPWCCRIWHDWACTHKGLYIQSSLLPSNLIDFGYSFIFVQQLWHLVVILSTSKEWFHVFSLNAFKYENLLFK